MRSNAAPDDNAYLSNLQYEHHQPSLKNSTNQQHQYMQLTRLKMSTSNLDNSTASLKQSSSEKVLKSTSNHDIKANPKEMQSEPFEISPLRSTDKKQRLQKQN